MESINLYSKYIVDRPVAAKGFLHYVGGEGGISIIICPGGGYQYLSDTENLM